MAYARACMDACGLADWRLQWDRAVCRLGLCRMTHRIISLSAPFVGKCLLSEPELIRRTILHEIAHALAWIHNRERTHGAAWQRWCAALGIPGERAAARGDFFAPEEARRPKYALCNRSTGEIYRYYFRKPQCSASKLASAYIPGKKAETLGKLCFVSLNSAENSPHF